MDTTMKTYLFDGSHAFLPKLVRTCQILPKSMKYQNPLDRARRKWAACGGVLL